MLISGDKLIQTLHYLPTRNLVYLNNAKVACSTVKKSLWLSADSASYLPEVGPHNRLSAPFCKDLVAVATAGTIASATFFTVVRNPFVRVLSAYLDKIVGNPRDTFVWHPFARRYRLSDATVLSFGDFLRMIADEDPYLLDQHFAPQYVNTLSDFVSCDFVGHIEEMEGVVRFLGENGVALDSHIPHPTGAANLIDKYYGPDEINIVLDIYANDFDLFGYSRSPHDISPAQNAYTRNISRDVIDLLIGGYTSVDVESRRRCIDAVGRLRPALLVDLNRLEVGAIDIEQLEVLSADAISGNIFNWKLAAVIAEELLKQNMVYEASSVAHRAKLLMYGDK